MRNWITHKNHSVTASSDFSVSTLLGLFLLLCRRRELLRIIVGGKKRLLRLRRRSSFFPRILLSRLSISGRSSLERVGRGRVELQDGLPLVLFGPRERELPLPM